MIDTNSLPYVDLGCAPDVLRQYAMDHFGKKISPAAKDETVIDRFQAIYMEETGIKLEMVAPIQDDDDGQDDDFEEFRTKSRDDEKKPAKRQPIAATIIVQDDEKDPGAICGSTQFVAYRIKRNTEVRVSIPILNSLRDAVKTVYDPKTMVRKDVIAYPFSIVEYHYADDEA